MAVVEQDRTAGVGHEPPQRLSAMKRVPLISFIHEDSAAFIDFRPFGFGYYFTDIASIHRDLGPGEHKTFLNGYRRVRELTLEDIGLIESFNEIM